MLALQDKKLLRKNNLVLWLIILSRDDLNSWPWMFLAVVFGADGGRVGAGPALTFSNSLDQDCFPCKITHCIEQALCVPRYAG